jgi:hypothetical protein
MRSTGSSVNMTTILQAERPRDPRSVPGRNKRCFSSAKRPDRLWDPLSSYSVGTGNKPAEA